MTCPNCGKEIAKDSNYCTKCGNYIKEDAAEINNDYFDSIEEIDEEEAIKKGLLNTNDETITIQEEDNKPLSELEEIFEKSDKSDEPEQAKEDDSSEAIEDLKPKKKKEKKEKKKEKEKSKFIDMDEIEEMSTDPEEVVEEKEEDNSSFFKKSKHESESEGFQNDRLLESFVGEDYKWIIRRPINIYAFIFSWIYFIYRKMYIIGTIGLMITGFVVRCYPQFLIYYIPAVMVLSSILFNPIYKLFAKSRIKYIIKKCEEDDYTEEQLCEKYGGVNVVITLIIFLFFLLVMLRTYFVFHINNENKKFWNENSENFANCKYNTLNDYKILQEKSIEGEFVDAVCSITMNNNKKRFNIYMKIKTKTQDKYLSFEYKDDQYLLLGSTGDYALLQKKNDDKTITEEELLVYKQLSDIRSKYYLKFDKAKEEDTLIKKRKNVSEKLNYIILKDDIFK